MRTFYTLRQKSNGKLADITCSGIDDPEFSGTYSADLWFDEVPQTLWVVSTKEMVEKVLAGVPWYNSSVDAPQLPSTVSKDDLEVVEIYLP